MPHAIRTLLAVLALVLAALAPTPAQAGMGSSLTHGDDPGYAVSFAVQCNGGAIYWIAEHDFSARYCANPMYVYAQPGSAIRCKHLGVDEPKIIRFWPGWSPWGERQTDLLCDTIAI